MLELSMKKEELNSLLQEIELPDLYNVIDDIEVKLIQYVCDTLVDHYGSSIKIYQELRTKVRAAATRYKNRAESYMQERKYRSAYGALTQAYLALWRELYLTVIIRETLEIEAPTAGAEDKAGRKGWGRNLKDSFTEIWDTLSPYGYDELILFNNVTVAELQTPRRPTKIKKEKIKGDQEEELSEEESESSEEERKKRKR